MYLCLVDFFDVEMFLYFIHSWGIVRICVGILRISIEMSFFACFCKFWFYLYNYNCELYMFDKPIDVLLWNYCEINVFLYWVIFPLIMDWLFFPLLFALYQLQDWWWQLIMRRQRQRRKKKDWFFRKRNSVSLRYKKIKLTFVTLLE